MKKLLSSMLLVAFAGSVNATVLFMDDFEGDLSAWTGKGGGANNAAIVTDPLDPTNNVLNFTALNAAGDTFTVDSFDPSTDIFVLSFRYLGTCTSGDCGGYVGYSNDLPGSHTWHYATGTASGAADVLIDDGTWHSYTFVLASTRDVHIMLEDYSGSGGVPGDAYFDDFMLTDGRATSVSAPSPFALVAVVSLVLAARARKS